MDVEDVLFDKNISREKRESIFEFMLDNEGISQFTKILIPTESNNDVDGSQQNADDFTYRDADEDDLENASSLGYYEYFSNYASVYTGHYYQGDNQKFEAIVLDPPAYAVSVTI